MAQVAKHLPSKHEAPSSKSVVTKRKKKKKISMLISLTKEIQEIQPEIEILFTYR
jgi:hypothetical protein